jgi:hypothetical protein
MGVFFISQTLSLTFLRKSPYNIEAGRLVLIIAT